MGFLAPNILWIVTTQWRAQATGYAGDVNARTPCVDALAREALNYAHAVTPHPLGPFARAALLTGVRCPQNGVRDYYDPLPEDARTVAHELGGRGYATAFFGKWHLAARDREAALVGEVHARMIVPPEARGGFELWEGFESGFLLNDPWLHGTRLPQPVQVRGYQSDVVCARAADEIKARAAEGMKGARPWFAVVSLEAPHPPYDAATPEGIVRMKPEDVVLAGNVPRGGEVEARARRELAGYYAHIEATDRAIGRLLACVTGTGAGCSRYFTETGANAVGNSQGRETYVVFTSVHGDMHGAHGLFRKGWPHEESVRVPLLVRACGVGRGAGSQKAGRSEAAVSLVDLPGMALAWAEGREWTCEREAAEISMPSVLALPHQCDRAWSGTRSATRKEIFNTDGTRWVVDEV